MTYTKYVYGTDIHILGLEIFKFCKLSRKQSLLDGLEIHVHSMAFQDNYSIALKRHDLLSDRIYQVYTMLYYIYTMLRSLANLHSCPRSFGSLGPRLPSDFLLATERSPTRGLDRLKFHNQVLIS